MIGFLLDEQLTAAYLAELRQREPALTVRRVGVGAAPPKGSADPPLLWYCEAHDLLLVTDNRASMPVHLAEHLAAGRHVPGILVMRPSADMGGIIDALLLLYGASLPDEFRDRIEYIPFI